MSILVTFEYLGLFVSNDFNVRHVLMEPADQVVLDSFVNSILNILGIEIVSEFPCCVAYAVKILVCEISCLAVIPVPVVELSNWIIRVIAC